MAPRPVPAPSGSQSISSQRSWPTSPIHRSPVDASKLMRHGLRRPVIQICGLPPPEANGLSRGTPSDRGRIDSQDLAEQRVAALAVALGIAGAPAVAEAGPEHVVGAEHQARRRCGSANGWGIAISSRRVDASARIGPVLAGECVLVDATAPSAARV